MSVEDSAMTREVLRDISKRPLDISGLDVHVVHGIIYLRGKLDRIRGSEEDMDLSEELHLIVRILKQKQGIRDVICEVDLVGPGVIERTSTHLKRVKY